MSSSLHPLCSRTPEGCPGEGVGHQLLPKRAAECRHRQHFVPCLRNPLALPLQLAPFTQRRSHRPAACRVSFRCSQTPSSELLPTDSANRLQRSMFLRLEFRGLTAMVPSVLPSNNLCQKNMAMTLYQKHSPWSLQSRTHAISSVWSLWLLSLDNTESDVKHSKPFLSRTTALEKLQSQHKKEKTKI